MSFNRVILVGVVSISSRDWEACGGAAKMGILGEDEGCKFMLLEMEGVSLP
jgi:hypothetical protein